MIRGFILLALAPLLCCAEGCAWINAGTVEGILGGDVETHVTQKSCVFEHRGGDKLSIVVETMTNPQSRFTKYLSACKSKPVPLEAVGNEAVTCSARHTGLVIGRVRDRAFVIRVTTNDRGATKEVLESKAEEAARHVAGNLF